MTTKIENPKQLARYWATILERRIPVEDETRILARVMCGYFLSHLTREENLDSFVTVRKNWVEWDKVFLDDQLLHFHGSKRPYGGRGIAESIAYHLGWDYERQLCFHAMPQVIEDECLKLHALVLEEIKENMWMYIGE